MKQIVSTSDPTLCLCGGQAASGPTLAGPWTCDRCGKDVALGGPPVGNISIRVDEAQYDLAALVRNGLAQQRGEYVFSAPKPTGLARKLQRRRKILGAPRHG